MMIVIPSFAVSTLVSFIDVKHSPNTEQSYSPLVVLNPKDTLSVGRHFKWCADCKVEVDTMRVVMTFLWMSEHRSS